MTNAYVETDAEYQVRVIGELEQRVWELEEDGQKREAELHKKQIEINKLKAQVSAKEILLSDLRKEPVVKNISHITKGQTPTIFKLELTRNELEILMHAVGGKADSLFIRFGIENMTKTQKKSFNLATKLKLDFKKIYDNYKDLRILTERKVHWLDMEKNND